LAGHQTLEEASDIVLINRPGAPVTDALAAAAVTGNVLLVIRPKANARPAITSARQQIDRVGARIIGGVLNGPNRSLAQAYDSY
jgi:Mrp family chromosome partitioning ATPase